ncbi:MAG: transporter substrate-binding domain-containing protein [Burkholderiaceae bacterium]|nr:transporter substrate-binding domain-containing protein [Burkholderiaceae bacterium]
MLYVFKVPDTNGALEGEYTWRLLFTALKRTEKEFGGFELRPSVSMSEAREIKEMESDAQLVNTISLATRPELEQNLIPVRIPTDCGLLGFRVFLIRAEDQPRFNKIKSIDDLKSVRIGQGAQWIDCQILEHAGLQVVRGSSFEGLFNMLENGRFDAFSRGGYEALRELQARHSALPDLAIEKTLLLYYPMPAYLWFPNTRDGKLRAHRVQVGMSAMVADGTLQKMFEAEYGSLAEKLDFKHRRLLKIDNPQLGPNDPLKNATLWYDPFESERRRDEKNRR